MYTVGHLGRGPGRGDGSPVGWTTVTLMHTEPWS
jgi:hypothetical protein